MMHEKGPWVPELPEFLHPPGLNILPGEISTPTSGNRQEEKDNSEADRSC